ncbi:DEAD/DEAH box helicase [Bacillus thermotolerans]|uniref:DEAD-box ATP-dependent RNA helicase CshA n=1 Tax=Bacillus thermotolerans TaxID=1221996 RepID=A0A0F5I2T2_BACTR|nr:DEAD/DEAH box helicase [Bacillus thermotolerans]KKB39740.1 DEAD-box ATP-dependent RNA helicase CshA [Bacillus thermotolerans]KKB39768.1 DEAD-box ATP-dependent RNA helicase CshA [Bacillus thermotolerans]
MTKFKDLNLSEPTLKAIDKMGFEEATPIQAQTIPTALEGNDVIGQAQTGTGKTTAFGVPMIEKVDTDDHTVQGLVIAPTRELAIQVSEELYKIGSGKRIGILAVYGGQDIQRQIRALKKRPHIIVGTPGRILDHINRRTLKLEHLQTLVLDEADEMLNMGFIQDIEAILSHMPAERQTLLFSATMPKQIRAIAERFMNNPVTIRVKAKEMTVSNIEQHFIKVHQRDKFDVLSRLIDVQSPELAIIFGRTKRRVDELANALSLRGYQAEGIHGDLTQAKRLTVLKRFKEGKIDVLVATDVAARGLDISGVTHVYNYDIPQDPESYVHRIGRTGRAGKEGVAITLVEPREMGYLREVERTTKKKMTPMDAPTWDDALIGQQQAAVNDLAESVVKNNLDQYKSFAKDLLDQYDSEELVAAALKLITKEPDRTPIRITDEMGLPQKKDGFRGKSSGSRKNSGGRQGGGRNYNRDRNRDRRGNSRRKYSSK